MAEEQEIARRVRELATRAKLASRRLASTPTAVKNAVLADVARALTEPANVEALLHANQRDLEAAKQTGLSGAMLDRLALSAERLAGVAEGVRQVAALSDPVGEVVQMKRLDNGLRVGRMRVPLGLIGIIYESRPNVTVDAAALCLKSGNAVLLRGGSEAFHSNTALAELFGAALRGHGLPVEAVALLPTTDRAATRAMIALEGVLDLIIPRGGESLIRFVTEHARVPVIQHYKGVCHVYVDGDADQDMAEAIVVNSKTQRPGVCNALETLLVDAACAEAFMPRVVAALQAKGVEIRGDDRTRQLAGVPTNAATKEDWDTEYLDAVASVAVVDGFDGALEHIARHGSGHTEAIVTRSYTRAERFLQEVDASLVLVNASTRFNDGFQLGLGAEIGISTTKLHAYGPMGLTELCTTKWIGYGDGQVRQ